MLFRCWSRHSDERGFTEARDLINRLADGRDYTRIGGIRGKTQRGLLARRKNGKGEKKHENFAQNNRNRKTRRLDYRATQPSDQKTEATRATDFGYSSPVQGLRRSKRRALQAGQWLGRNRQPPLGAGR